MRNKISFSLQLLSAATNWKHPNSTFKTMLLCKEQLIATFQNYLWSQCSKSSHQETDIRALLMASHECGCEFPKQKMDHECPTMF